MSLHKDIFGEVCDTKEVRSSGGGGLKGKEHSRTLSNLSFSFQKLCDYLVHFFVYKLQEPIPFIVGNLKLTFCF